MKNRSLIIVLFLVFSTTVSGQSVLDLINEVNLDSLKQSVKEFSGEESTVVSGHTITIKNREKKDNSVAAQYIFEKLKKLEGLTVVNQEMFKTDERINVIAKQQGKTNPDNIYIICAHYDSVSDYCADDNASGVSAVLEVARILSTQCFDNTIVYAFWDEEEVGLIGSKYYAELAKHNSDRILGVYNLDMIGYDGDNNTSFDIDVKQDDEGSTAMSNDIIAVLNEYALKLKANIISPGTEASDHASFWNRGFPAVLIGEAWSEKDQNPKYHTVEDRISLFNLQYFQELTKLSVGYMATKAGLTGVDNSVSWSGVQLVAYQDSAVYQWFNCNTGNAVEGAVYKSFTPLVNGSYSVQVTSGDCVEKSSCFEVNTLGVESFLEDEVIIYANPVKSELKVEVLSDDFVTFDLFDVTGNLVFTFRSLDKVSVLPVSKLQEGIYFLTVKTNLKSGTFKIIKE